LLRDSLIDAKASFRRRSDSPSRGPGKYFLWHTYAFSRPREDFRILNLDITDGILLVVNLFGVWRWLGRQSGYEDSGACAAAHSRGAPVPTLFPAGSLVGASIKGPDDATRGVVAEAMLNCDDKSLAYVVIGEGGVAGAEWRALPATEHHRWPTAPPKDAQPRGRRA
jgi:hypothetical protein